MIYNREDRSNYTDRGRVGYRPRISNSAQNSRDLHDYRSQTSYASDEPLFKIKGKITQANFDYINLETAIGKKLKVYSKMELHLAIGTIVEIEGVIREEEDKIRYEAKIITIYIS